MVRLRSGAGVCGCRRPELAILFAYAAPDYFIIQFSGLTEPLFGLVLVGVVALADDRAGPAGRRR